MNAPRPTAVPTPDTFELGHFVEGREAAGTAWARL